MTTRIAPPGWKPDPNWKPTQEWLDTPYDPGPEPVDDLDYATPDFGMRHGQHDQKSHGRKGGSGDPAHIGEQVAEELVGKVRSEGGFSYHAVDAHSPKSGVMVSPYPKRTTKIRKEDLQEADIERFAARNADLLVKRDHYIGAWEEEGHVYLDVSVRTTTVAAARTLNSEAKANQIAAWDLTHKHEVQLGGTGE
jgi:hypothetical protein